MAKEAIDEMARAGFPISRVTNTYQTALEQFELNNFETAFGISNEIIDIKENAFAVDTLIKEIQEGISKSKEQWLNVPETENALQLVLKAFEREDFTTALQRAKDAQLTFILETKGRINLLWFFKAYWWAILLSIIFVLILSFVLYKRLVIMIINQRLRNLFKEESSIGKLIKEAQFKYAKENSISASEYHKLLDQYESRLKKIHQLKAKLRNKRVSVVRTEQEFYDLKREENEITELIKKDQKEYLQLGKLSRANFLGRYESNRKRLAEIKEEEGLVHEKIAKKQFNKLHKFLLFINKIYLNVMKLLKKKKEVRKIPDRHEAKKPVQKCTEQKMIIDHTAKEKTEVKNRARSSSLPRPSVAVLIDLFPGALTIEQQKEALRKEETMRVKTIKKEENKPYLMEAIEQAKPSEEVIKREYDSEDKFPGFIENIQPTEKKPDVYKEDIKLFKRERILNELKEVYNG